MPEENARMTNEQLNELGEALCVMSAKSSVLKERDELRALMEENLQGDEVTPLSYVMPQDPFNHLVRTQNHLLAH